MIQTLKNLEIPEHNLITVSYIVSLFVFAAIVASIPIIVCLVNKSPNFFPEDKHIPMTFRDYDQKNKSNKSSKRKVPAPPDSVISTQAASEGNIHHISGPYSVLHHNYLSTTPLKKSWRAIISVRYLIFAISLVVFQFAPFIQISVILVTNLVYCIMVWKVMPWRRKCEGVVEGLVEGWVIGADFGFWILCLDDLVMGITGVDSLVDNRKGGITIREGMRLLG